MPGPIDPANLLFWLDATLGITQDTGGVSQWDDQSSAGINMSQATPDRRPDVLPAELSGLDVVDFDLAQVEWLQAASNALLNLEFNQAFTIALLCRIRSETGAGFWIGKRDSSVGGGRGYMLRKLLSNRWRWDHRNTASNRIDIDFTRPADGNWHSVILTKSTSSAASGVNLYIDGVAGTPTVNSDNLSLTTVNNGTLSVGVDSDGATFPVDGSLAEMMVANYELNATDAAALHTYFDERWINPPPVSNVHEANRLETVFLTTSKGMTVKLLPTGDSPRDADWIRLNTLEADEFTPVTIDPQGASLFIEGVSTAPSTAPLSVVMPNRGMTLYYNENTATWRGVHLQQGHAMQYLGEWQPRFYPPQAVVWDDNWTMVSLRQTEDRAAPQAVGDPTWLLPDSPTWTGGSATEDVILWGMRFTVTDLDPGGFWRAARIDIPEVNPLVNYRLFMVYDPLGLNIPTEILLTTGPAIGWLEISKLMIVQVGDVYDLVAVAQSQEGVSTVNANYQYNLTNADPLSGEISHRAAGGGNTMLIHYTDADATDRQATLDALLPGDEIEIDGFTWAILETIPGATFLTATVTPSTRGTAGLFAVTFRTRAPTPIAYNRLPNFWSGDPHIQGFLSLTGSMADAVFSDDAYGVDAQAQPAAISPDWGVLSLFTGGA